MATLHVLRVFTAASGAHGNPLGVFSTGGDIPEECRQPVALDLGFSETVFVDDAERAEMRIFTPQIELPFAGHPSVGTAWLLRQEMGGRLELPPLVLIRRARRRRHGGLREGQEEEARLVARLRRLVAAVRAFTALNIARSANEPAAGAAPNWRASSVAFV